MHGVHEGQHPEPSWSSFSVQDGWRLGQGTSDAGPSAGRSGHAIAPELGAGQDGVQVLQVPLLRPQPKLTLRIVQHGGQDHQLEDVIVLDQAADDGDEVLELLDDDGIGIVEVLVYLVHGDEAQVVEHGVAKVVLPGAAVADLAKAKL